MRAILSVSDKTNLVDFAKQLQEMKVEIYQYGGYQKVIRDRRC